MNLMKQTNDGIKWLFIVLATFLFVSFSITLPSVSAQEGTPPIPSATSTGTVVLETEEPLIATATPTEITEDSTFFLTAIPTAFTEETPLQAQEAEQQAPPFQTMQQPGFPPESIWPAFNISDTDTASIDPSFAVDSAGNIHMVWAEAQEGNKWDIYYAYTYILTTEDGEKKLLSRPINVSQSPSFSSGDPQIALDNSGTVHIVWMEEDNDYVNDSEIMYSHCSISENAIINCEPSVSLSGPLNWDCGNFLPDLQDWASGAPAITINQSNKVMVVWRASEPAQITQPYSTWQAGATPPTIRTGCAPMGGISDLYRYVGGRRVAGGESNFGMAFSSLYNGVDEIFYTEFTNNSWSTPILVTTGGYPDLFLDKNTGQSHVSLCTTNGNLKYWNITAQSLENIPANSCAGGSSIVVDSNGIPHVFWVEGGQVYLSKNDGGWSAAQMVNQSSGGEGRPDAAADNNGNVHVVWQDTRDGIAEAYYSYSYSCEGIVTCYGKCDQVK